MLSEVTFALNQCLGPADEASCLPPACYTSEAICSSEIDVLFRGGWIGIGRADRLPELGDFEAFDIVGVPLLLCRDESGVLRAFNNSCRHRGARLADGCGNGKLFRCPFHSWAYSVDGRLVSAPDMEACKQFDKTESGLIEFPLHIHAGFLFICFDEQPVSFESGLGDFDDHHQAWPLDSLTTVRRKEFLFDCNWKAFLDVFNEYYHLRFVHPDSINSLYNIPDVADAVTGNYATQFGQTQGTGALLASQQSSALPPIPGLPDRESRGARYTWLFPNMAFAAGTDALWLYEVYPLAAGQSQVYQSLCLHSDSLNAPGFEDKAADYFDRLDAALEEDRVALENQHRGLMSPYSTAGRFSPLLESNVASFARWYAGRMISQ